MAYRYLGAALLLFATLPAAAEPAPAVHEYRLDNGLKLIVKEDHRAPVVVSEVWYRIGSSYEHDGITGISHVLEHLMFKGTKAHGPNEFSRIIAENGGRENAFTSRDYTGYYQQLGNDRLPIAFELEADRMRNLDFSDEEFAKEVKVVMEERRLRTDDDPQSLTYEEFQAAAWHASPYGNPVIGWMGDLEGLTAADLRDWYRQWYAPNNATLVVVGDVQPEAVYALAQQHFGPLKAEPITPPRSSREPPQHGERRVTVKAPAELPYLIMGYKAPALGGTGDDWEPYALEVLAGILDGGDSARLSRELVRGREIAASAGAGYDAHARLDQLFLLEGTPATGHTVAELEEALRAEIRRLQESPVSDEELQRVKAQTIAGEVFQRDSVYYQAMLIGQMESLGYGWRALEAYAPAIEAVTAEQVQAVAKKYLTDDRLTVARLDPQPLDGKAARHSQGRMNDVR